MRRELTMLENLPLPNPSGSWEYSFCLPDTPRAVPLSRHTLWMILNHHGHSAVVDTAELLVTELLSNSVRHTKGPAAMQLWHAGGVLQIGSWDADPEPPSAPRELGLAEYAESGRGLALVRACSEVWGWQAASRYGYDGKRVWCRIPTV